MATSQYFNGKKVTLPGVYSTIKSGIKNPSAVSDYGKCVLIDTGTGATWGGGAGISGQFSSGQDSIYSFNNLKSFRDFVKGGLFWKAAEGLFTPKKGAQGISELIYVKAATTTAASMSLAFDNMDSEDLSDIIETETLGIVLNAGVSYVLKVSANFTDNVAVLRRGSFLLLSTASGDEIYTRYVSSVETDGFLYITIGIPEYETINVSTTYTIYLPTVGGSVGFNTLDEGLSSNGSTYSSDTSKLSKGYGYLLSVAPRDATKYVMNFYVGSWTGIYTDGLEFDEVLKVDSEAKLILQSIEFNDIDTLYNWMVSDSAFNRLFKVVPNSYKKLGTGILPESLSYFSSFTYNEGFELGRFGYNIASGATETYSTVKLQEALEQLREVDFSFILCDKFGTVDYVNIEVTALNNFINNDYEYIAQMFYGAGNTVSEFNQSTSSSRDAAEYFNDDKNIVVHGSFRKSSQSAAAGYRVWDSFIHAAYLLGRTAGLPPQIPITFKTMDFDGLTHDISKEEKEDALKYGILATFFDKKTKEYTILQGINSLQNNINVVNSDATTFSIQMKRIVAQINKDIAINARRELFSTETGVNRNSLSEARLAAWTASFLQQRVSTSNTDNLILSFSDITVERVEDTYNVTYKIVPNGEITKVFFTGFMVD